jgi:predicted acylesterase/phospholipase RssA
VTGVSTGALTAPFAFLGPAYDPQLRAVYTDLTLADIAESRGLIRAVFHDSLADTAPLFRTISRYLDEPMLAAIARAYEGGRLLLIGTTHLDAQVPVIWNIGAIAASGHPRALDLVRRVLLASASIPGAFAPVMLDVMVDGEAKQEMHVDGGAFAQAFLYPASVGTARRDRLRRGTAAQGRAGLRHPQCTARSRMGECGTPHAGHRRARHLHHDRGQRLQRRAAHLQRHAARRRRFQPGLHRRRFRPGAAGPLRPGLHARAVPIRLRTRTARLRMGEAPAAVMPAPCRRALLAGGTALLSGCALPERGPPVPSAVTAGVTVLGVPDERFVLPQDLHAIDAAFREAGRRRMRHLGLTHPSQLPRFHLLGVSGGGEDGAFGAGLLCGWTAQGTRPEFELVTGVSTGALTAPFAFLGPDWDGPLRSVYTDITPDDVLRSRGLLAAIFNDALADSAPLFRTISRHLDERMLAAIGRGHEAGRLLLIGSTNLDAQLPVIWNVGAIAASGHPRALDLVRRILLASAAIPGAFPPVMFDVSVNGVTHQEMHVDGGGRSARSSSIRARSPNAVAKGCAAISRWCRPAPGSSATAGSTRNGRRWTGAPCRSPGARSPP